MLPPVFYRTAPLAGGSCHLLKPVSDAARSTRANVAGFTTRMNALSHKIAWFVGVECLKPKIQQGQHRILQKIRRKRGVGVVGSNSFSPEYGRQQCDVVSCRNGFSEYSIPL